MVEACASFSCLTKNAHEACMEDAACRLVVHTFAKLTKFSKRLVASAPMRWPCDARQRADMPWEGNCRGWRSDHQPAFCPSFAKKRNQTQISFFFFRKSIKMRNYSIMSTLCLWFTYFYIWLAIKTKFSPIPSNVRGDGCGLRKFV